MHSSIHLEEVESTILVETAVVYTSLVCCELLVKQKVIALDA